MSRRPLQLASIVRELIAPVLRECPPACGVVTITEVVVSSDLSYATVYVSALREPKDALAFLESRTPQLQREMGKLRTHKTPRLRFRMDTRAAEGDRIDELLKKVDPSTRPPSARLRSRLNTE